MSRRIALLFHEADQNLDLRMYTVTKLISHWEADGHEVVKLFGTSTKVSADIVFLHVDLSVVPEEYLAFATSYPAAVNGRVRDIRKSVFSPYLLPRNDPWPGPVIVKSDRNYGGLPEAMRQIPRLDGRGIDPAFRSPYEYRIYKRVQQVPAWVFDSPDLVVQRFLPEIEDGLFHIRNYQFLGDWEDCRRQASEQPVVKAATKVSSIPAPVHPGVREIRHRHGLDFGKIDYVIHDGELVVLDLNKTTGGRGANRDSNPHVVAGRPARARGLYSLFP